MLLSNRYTFSTRDRLQGVLSNFRGFGYCWFKSSSDQKPCRNAKNPWKSQDFSFQSRLFLPYGPDAQAGCTGTSGPAFVSEPVGSDFVQVGEKFQLSEALTSSFLSFEELAVNSSRSSLAVTIIVSPGLNSLLRNFSERASSR